MMIGEKTLLSKVVYMTPPSPVVLVSTIDADGNGNLAPFGMFMACGHDPPALALGINRQSDTHRNIKTTEDFVVGIPTPEIAQKLFQAGAKYPPNVKEFIEVGLTPIPATSIRPNLIKECQSNLECKLLWMKTAGDHDIIVGKVIAAHIWENLWNDDKVKLRWNLIPLYHVSGGNFIAGLGRKIRVNQK